MKTKSMLQSRLAASAAMLGSTLATPWALAKVNDLPGGPGVNQLNLTPGATAMSLHLHDLHNFVMWVCLVIFVDIFRIIFYSILKHRKSLNYKTASFHESVTIEIL